MSSRMTVKKATVRFVVFVLFLAFLLNGLSLLRPTTPANDINFHIRKSRSALPNETRALKEQRTTSTSSKSEGNSWRSSPSDDIMAVGEEKRLGATRIPSTQKDTRPPSAKTYPDDLTIRNRFLARKSRIASNCDPDIIEQPSRRPGYTYAGNRHFQVCLLRKVASTFLGSYTRSLKHDDATHVEFYGKPPSPSRLVVVRDPYTRLASGYVDRVLTNPQKLHLFRPRDVNEFWPNANAVEAQARCLCAVSFRQFAKYLIYFHDTGKRIDNHFRAMSVQCNPCRMEFDFIVDVETLDEDLAYISKRLNVTAFSPQPSRARGVYERPRSFEKMLRGPEPCKSLCSVFRNLWWSYQATGFMSRSFKFPVSPEKCANTSANHFSKLALHAIEQSKNSFDRSVQKRQMMAELFLQLPLEDRIKIRDMFAKDFQLFGYDAQPADLFPELANGH